MKPAATPGVLRRLGLDRDIVIELVIVVALGLAVFSIVSLLPTLAQAGVPLVAGWRSLEQRTFGAAVALLPVAIGTLCILALLQLRFHGPPIAWRRWTGGALLFVASLALADALGVSGGSAGHWIRTLLVSFVGAVGAVAVLLFVVIAGIALLFHLTPHHARLGTIGSYRALAFTTRHAIRGARGTVRLARGRLERQTTPLPVPFAPVSRRTARHGGKSATVLSPAPSPVDPTATRSPGDWSLPDINWLDVGEVVKINPTDTQLRCNIIQETLASFNIPAKVDIADVRSGPTVTQFGIRPAPGVKVSRITGLRDDLALALEAPSVRMEAPVPGRPYVGIEVPNTTSQNVGLREVLTSEPFKRLRGRLRLALGQDVAGQPVVADLARMPHLLIAGATGSGKSACLNSIIATLLYELTPDELQLVMVDPKRVELTGFNGVPHLRVPVVVEMEKVVGALQWTIDEMERRYDLFAGGGHRNLERYNQSMRERQLGASVQQELNFDQYNASAEQQKVETLPYIVVIIDELADLMMTAPQQVEQMLCRLAQKARATGIHLIVATQRPSVDVVTGLIKANFPTRIAFAVSSLVDSRTIIDQPGAEKLLGRGDMLYTPADSLKPVRVQGTWVHESELEKVVEFWKNMRASRPDWRSEGDERALLTTFQQQESSPQAQEERLIEEACQVVQQYEKASASLLQRRLRISYSKAALIMDELQDRGYVGPPEGTTRSRVVLLRETDGAT
jgi:S-DNA-T family DNA segregation ATPase FtsK/SpoIIIE